MREARRRPAIDGRKRQPTVAAVDRPSRNPTYDISSRSSATKKATSARPTWSAIAPRGTSPLGTSRAGKRPVCCHLRVDARPDHHHRRDRSHEPERHQSGEGGAKPLPADRLRRDGTDLGLARERSDRRRPEKDRVQPQIEQRDPERRPHHRPPQRPLRSIELSRHVDRGIPTRIGEGDPDQRDGEGRQRRPAPSRRQAPDFELLARSATAREQRQPADHDESHDRQDLRRDRGILDAQTDLSLDPVDQATGDDRHRA